MAIEKPSSPRGKNHSQKFLLLPPKNTFNKCWFFRKNGLCQSPYLIKSFDQQVVFDFNFWSTGWINFSTLRGLIAPFTFGFVFPRYTSLKSSFFPLKFVKPHTFFSKRGSLQPTNEKKKSVWNFALAPSHQPLCQKEMYCCWKHRLVDSGKHLMFSGKVS